MTERIWDALVVGAGWAGLAAADALHAAGQSVVVLEKARGPGGRSATRRHNDWSFDHGAQYFTAYSEAFQASLAKWSDLGLVRPWLEPIGVFGQRPDHLSRLDKEGPVTRWVGVPGNNAVLKALSEGLATHYEHTVTAVISTEGGWRIEAKADGQTRLFLAKQLVLTAPPAQSAALLGKASALFPVLNAHVMAPTLALMLGFDQPLGLDVSAGFVNDGPLSWFCQQSTKPGRAGETWVIHATSQWSDAHLDAPQANVGSKMYQAWLELVGGIDQEPTWMQTHRWRYAQSPAPLDQGYLSDKDRRVWVAGDWCNSNRVEGAWLSGRGVAQALTT